MKQKDIALIVVVVFVSGIFSYLLSSVLIGDPTSRVQTAEVVEPISTDFTQPDEQYFNESAVNPTQTIEIGDTNNPVPFENAD